MHSLSLDSLFAGLWQDFTTRLCPSAAKVHALLEEGTPLINDHIALRTFSLDNVNLERLAAPFIACGYLPKEDYVFRAKKLTARYYQHPDPKAAKVFISQLELSQCSANLQQIVQDKVSSVDAAIFAEPDFLYHGRPWQLDFATYQQLAAESEYAAWVGAHGYGANHFTVDVRELRQYQNLTEVNAALRRAGFLINEVGGEIKGGKSVFLGQSATLADKVPVHFSDGEQIIAGGFYEFAKRYAMENGALYQGFVEASANSIFESTNNR